VPPNCQGSATVDWLCGMPVGVRGYVFHSGGTDIVSKAFWRRREGRWLEFCDLTRPVPGLALRKTLEKVQLCGVSL
jgi:hypothetical protein